MLFLLLRQAFSLLFDYIWVSRRDDRDKDLEILLLRQQLRMLQRMQPQAPRISRWEKLTLLVLVGKLTAMTAARPSIAATTRSRRAPHPSADRHRGAAPAGAGDGYWPAGRDGAGCGCAGTRR